MGLLWDLIKEIFSTTAVHPIYGDPRMDREIREQEWRNRRR